MNELEALEPMGMNQTTDLYCLVYQSEATTRLNTQKLEEIISKASKRNPEFDITGVLLSDGSYFIQYLEGPKGNLDQLYQIIANSTSHHNLKVLVKQPIDQREFPKWFMGLLQPTESEMLDIMNWDWWDNINDRPWSEHSNSGVQMLRRFCANHGAAEVGAQDF